MSYLIEAVLNSEEKSDLREFISELQASEQKYLLRNDILNAFDTFISKKSQTTQAALSSLRVLKAQPSLAGNVKQKARFLDKALQDCDFPLRICLFLSHQLQGRGKHFLFPILHNFQFLSIINLETNDTG